MAHVGVKMDPLEGDTVLMALCGQGRAAAVLRSTAQIQILDEFLINFRIFAL